MSQPCRSNKNPPTRKNIGSGSKPSLGVTPAPSDGTPDCRRHTALISAISEQPPLTVASVSVGYQVSEDHLHVNLFRVLSILIGVDQKG